MELLLAASGVILLLVIGSIWKGFVFMKLWGWFAVPFFGVPAMPLAMAIGIGVMVGFLVHQYQYAEDNRSTETKVWAGIGWVIFYPAMVLLIGWVVTLFI